MSTKIYHGMKTDLTDLNEIRRLALEFKESTVIPLTNERGAIGTAFLGMKLIDGLKCGIPLKTINFSIGRCKFEGDPELFLMQEWENCERERVKFLNTKFTLALHPLKNKTLLLPITSNNKLLEEFKKLNWVDDYGYWDNTDPDEECTEEEWGLREKDWSFLDYSPTIEQMFTLQLHPTYTGLYNEFIDLERIEEYIDRVASLKGLLKKLFKEELNREVEFEPKLDSVIKENLPSMVEHSFELNMPDLEKITKEVDLIRIAKDYIKKEKPC